jgi:NAD(P)-dependent dehydrogenase (short-subunit alcohol dehydrogenase family)
VRAIGAQVTAVQGDVSNPADMDRLFSKIRSEHDRIDILFANAGLGALEPLGKIMEAAFDLVFGLNVKGTVFTVQKGLPLMQDGGSIILMGSTAGATGTPGFSIYSASKAAIRNLARSWALDLRGDGIRVNVLSPGPTSTPGIEGLKAHLASIGQKDAVPSLIPETTLGRMGRPEEVAAVALFLASDDSSFMTGSEVFVDGGVAQV